MRRAIAMIVAVGLLVAGIAASDLANNTPVANAADAADFHPGNIVTDVVFYNDQTMTLAEIQSFLNSKLSNCRSGYTCLKDYKASTRTRGGDSQCSTYSGAANESAATIIYKVAQACNINPQVLIVTLEKEQSLVTDDWPGSGQYRSAMGYGCPDTAPCDADYYGFFNQVYMAAHQFQVYRQYPNSFGYVAGRTNSIQYYPNKPSCGTAKVYIESQATAGLYNYTPYVPNAAALKNLYGLGDGCSTYGNRNFWRIFTDWFGSTQGYVAATQLMTLWNQTGGSSGTLGYATAKALNYTDGGIGQEFQRGWAYWSSSSGSWATSGHIGRSYITLVGPKGILGYPIAAQRNEPGGAVSQAFQNGSLYTTPAGGIHRVATTILTAYLALGGPGGTLGYSTDSTQSAPNGGLVEPFDKGTLYWSSTFGAFNVPQEARAAYSAVGGPGGTLGYPIADVVVDRAGASVLKFENGSISWSANQQPKVATAPHLIADRIGGDDRYDVAIGVSKAAFPAGAPVVYVASGSAFADALSAAPAASKEKGPLLLTTGSSLRGDVRAEIVRLHPSKIVIVGGPASVSSTVEKQLRKISTTTRLGGATRYDVSVNVANYAFKTPKSVFIATGQDYPDALSAAAVAGTRGSPVILVDGRLASLAASTQSLLEAISPDQAYIVGGPASVSSEIQMSLNKIVTTSRYSGADRFEVNASIQRALIPNASSAFVATGYNYPDALSGAVLSAVRAAPLYLVSASCVPVQAWVGIRLSSATKLTILGGTGSVGPGVADLTRCS